MCNRFRDEDKLGMRLIGMFVDRNERSERVSKRTREDVQKNRESERIIAIIFFNVESSIRNLLIRIP